MLAVNSVIQWDEESGRDKFERIIWLDQKNDIAFVYPLTPDVNANVLPFQCSLSELESAINDNLAVQRTVDPYSKSFDLNYIEKYKSQRDKAWSRIKNIALDEPDIYNPELRGKMVQEIVEEKIATKMTIYKDLRKYWRYGKTINAMLPLYNQSGAAGRERKITSEMLNDRRNKGGNFAKRGRPRKGSKDYTELIGINLTVEDEENIRKVIINNFQNNTKPTLVEAHEELLKHHYTIVDKNGDEIIDPLGRYPTLGQFKYYVYKNQDLRKTIIKREGLNIYNQRHRPVMGVSTQNEQIGPGSYYQLDATTLGVHLVNRLDRKRKISKPILYLVTDVMSRKIVGFHIGLGSSWEEARMALLDAFFNQGEFTNDIKDDINKICYLPQVIVTDNGPELKGFDSDGLVESLGIRVTNAPPYRPDLKAIVEQLFNSIRMKLRKLPGFVKKGNKERGAKDYRLDATLDIEEITDIVKEICLLHNHHNLMSNYPQEEAMMKSDIVPYPVNIWHWGSENKVGAFKQISTDKAIISLLKKSNATITPFGIKFNKRYYSSSRGLKEQWFIRGGPYENKKVKIAFDYRDAGTIYLILDDGQTIEHCTLQPRSRQFNNYYVEEAKDWFEKQIEQKNRLQRNNYQVKMEVENKIDDIVENSKRKTLKEQKQNPKSKTGQLREINSNRNEARKEGRENISQTTSAQLNKLMNDDENIKNDKVISDLETFEPDVTNRTYLKSKLKTWRKKGGVK